MKAGSTFAKVASNSLWNNAKKQDGNEYEGTTVHGVAAVDGAFFVRTGTAMYRIGKAIGR